MKTLSDSKSETILVKLNPYQSKKKKTLETRETTEKWTKYIYTCMNDSEMAKRRKPGAVAADAEWRKRRRKRNEEERNTSKKRKGREKEASTTKRSGVKASYSFIRK